MAFETDVVFLQCLFLVRLTFWLNNLSQRFIFLSRRFLDFNTEAYLGPHQMPLMDLLCEFVCFHKKHHYTEVALQRCSYKKVF